MNLLNERFWAIVPAAGSGRRMGGEVPKQYLTLLGRRVIEHTLDRLLCDPRIEAVYVALAAGDAWWPETAFADHPRVIRVPGGTERCHSVCAALERLRDSAAPQDWVLVHDAARPCIHWADLDRLITGLARDPVGGLLAAPLHDTIKQADAQGRVVATIPRECLWRALTPQMFRLQPLLEALTQALAKDLLVTDDASAMELAGFAPRLLQGRADNIKITRPEDLALAEFYLAQQSTEQRPVDVPVSPLLG
jgi:2-C-methyl-D-erythritol 4-phosphate cytidylyltransferase